MSSLPKIGVDIGASSIKMVELVSAGQDKFKLLIAASLTTSEGMGLASGQVNIATIATTIAKMCREAGTHSKQVVASLPEEQVFSHLVEMPVMSDSEVEQALQWQVEQYIPIPADQAVWSYQIVKRDTQGPSMEVLLAAVPKTLANTYRQVFEQAGLEPVALETELMATARAISAINSPLQIVVDIGAKGTDLGICRGGQLIFARTIPTAGEAFTRAIETTLGLDAAQAEQYKNTYGFTKNQLEGKLAEAMKPVLKLIADEIKKTIDLYTSKHRGEVVKSAILAGGVAVLPEIVGELSAQLGLEVVVGNPFVKVQMDDAQRQALSASASFYSVAAGLSMYGG